MRRLGVLTAVLGLSVVMAQGAAADPVLRAPVAAVSRAAATAPRTALHPAAAAAPVTINVSFAPRNAALLDRLAARSSAAAGLSNAQLTQLFAPAPATVAGVTTYLQSHGLAATGGGILSRSYSGSVADAEAAFGTQLVAYRAAGVSFRAPSSTPTLPAPLAASVTAIDGLDTYPLVKPAIAPRVVPPIQLISTCSATAAVHNNYGGYEPFELAAAAAYDVQPVMLQNHVGQGNSMALIEFSNYDAGAVATYQQCYGTSVPLSDVTVGTAPSDSDGAVEVQLDQEVAIGAAPGLDHIYTYNAANGTGFNTMIDRIVFDRSKPTNPTNVNIVSISWGGCEAAMGSGYMNAAHAEFNLAAVAGLSIFAASGDDGASDCTRSTGSTAAAVDYPASDPAVTGVGGTTLDTSASGANREVTWGSPATASGGGGGGGVSKQFQMPSWQTGSGVIEPGYSSTAACGQTVIYCREVPDIALDANPDTGYVVRVTSGGNGVWGQVGGTSAAAPLMAGLTADVNSASVAGGGTQLGFANPFLYAHPEIFRDITLGTNAVNGGPAFPAGTGYDMATGLGSPAGEAFAAALTAATQPTANDTTTLTGASSAASVTPGTTVTLSGTLTDATTAQPLAGRLVTVTGSFTVNGQLHPILLTATTGAGGGWTTTVTTATVGARFTWHAAYAGESGIAASQSPDRTLTVLPTLTTGSSLKWSGTQYTIKHGKPVTLNGRSTPAMAGAKLTVQTKLKGGTTWKPVGITVTVALDGTYKTPIGFTKAVKESIRFVYTGTASGPWLSATSPARLFVVT